MPRSDSIRSQYPSNVYTRAVHAALGLQTHSGCWAEVEATPEFVERFERVVLEARAARRAAFMGWNVLVEKLPTDRVFEWYRVASAEHVHREGQHVEHHRRAGSSRS